LLATALTLHLLNADQGRGHVVYVASWTGTWCFCW